MVPCHVGIRSVRSSSGRADLNSRPPAPKAGALTKTTVLFSTLLLKQSNLAVMIACGWLCANVPICLLGGHKSWHNRDAALAPDSHTGSCDIRIPGEMSFGPPERKHSPCLVLHSVGYTAKLLSLDQRWELVYNMSGLVYIPRRLVKTL